MERAEHANQMLHQVKLRVVQERVGQKHIGTSRRHLLQAALGGIVPIEHVGGAAPLTAGIKEWHQHSHTLCPNLRCKT